MINFTELKNRIIRVSVPMTANDKIWWEGYISGLQNTNQIFFEDVKAFEDFFNDKQYRIT